MSAEIRDIRSARLAKLNAEKELMDYMVWTMTHENDPHEFHADPIAVFREEMNARRLRVA
jgi:hypothetical protein